MTRYCITIDEQNGCRSYGLDLLSYREGRYTVLMSKPNITNKWRQICEIARYANITYVQPNLFDEFLEIILAVKRRGWTAPPLDDRN